MNVGSHAANHINYSGMAPVMGVNGVPPHLSSTLYQSANSGLTAAQDEYWTGKMGRLPSNNAHVANDLTGSQSANNDHKMVCCLA